MCKHTFSREQRGKQAGASQAFYSCRECNLSHSSSPLLLLLFFLTPLILLLLYKYGSERTAEKGTSFGW